MTDKNPSTPASDPLIDEVRAVRKELSDRFGNDVGRLCEYLRQVEAERDACRKAAAITDAASK